MSQVNLDNIRKLTKSLNSSRAQNYTTWLQVGWCLYNLDQSLLNCWIEFSRRSPKFKEGECEQLWHSWSLNIDANFGLGSLIYWNQIDNGTSF